MRLLFVITELDEGGAEQVFERVVGAAGKKHEVGVVCLFHKDGNVGHRIQKNGMPVEELGITGMSTLYRARRLTRSIVSFQPDLIHSWLFHANVITRVIAPEGIPVVSSLRVAEPRRSHLWLERLTRKRCSRFLCVSQAVETFPRAFAIVDIQVKAESIAILTILLGYLTAWISGTSPGPGFLRSAARAHR